MLNLYKMFFVYIIQSLKDDSFYVGQCEDLDKRMSKYNDCFSKYTAGKIPWRLVYFEIFASRSDAIKRETEIFQEHSRARKALSAREAYSLCRTLDFFKPLNLF